MTDMELEQFIAQYGTDIYSFCCCLTGSRQEADDLYQETFLRAVEKKDILEQEGNPKSYLLSVSVRIWNNQRRKKAWRKRIAHVEPAANGGTEIPDLQEEYRTPEIRIIMEERRQAVREAVVRLPAKMKTVVLLYYMEERTVEQIAHILHVPKGTVKSRLYHARQILQRELEYMRNE